MRVLICVSDFPYSRPTVEFAAQIISVISSEITLLTVRPKDDPTGRGENTLDEAESLLPQPANKRIVRYGQPAKEILSEEQTGRYNLIIVGARDNPRLTDLLLGSVARNILTRSKTSVLIVRHPTEKIRQLLICTAGRKTSLRTVETGAHFARLTGARVKLLHVAQAVPAMYASLEQIEETLDEFLHSNTPLAKNLIRQRDLLDQFKIRTEMELRHGIPAGEILDAIGQEDFDLLVIGRTSTRLNRLVMDEVSREIVDHSPRPVLVVKDPIIST